MLSSLQNWEKHVRYRLRPSTPAQLCWSSSRLQPLQNYTLIKFAIIRPSTLKHYKNLWNCRARGARRGNLFNSFLFGVPAPWALICTKLFNVCANKLSLSGRNIWMTPKLISRAPLTRSWGHWAGDLNQGTQFDVGELFSMLNSHAENQQKLVERKRYDRRKSVISAS